MPKQWSQWPSLFYLSFLALFLVGLMACAPTTIPTAATNYAATIPTIPPATPFPTPALPSLSVYDVAGNSGYPAPVAAYPVPEGGLPVPIISAKAPAPPTPTNIPTIVPPTATAVALAPDVPPPPTFTPPALPQTSADEHYWFRRPVAEGGVVWTDKYYPYGSTRGGTLRTHHGVEFNVDYNTPILSVASGTIVFAGSDSQELLGPELNFYGNAVVIQHDGLWQGQPVYTLYGHLNTVNVVVGQPVAAQEQIGLSGATGTADGPHMHFEVRVGSNAYDNTRNPLLWLYPFPDRGAIAGRVIFPDGSFAPEAAVTIRRLDGGSSFTATTTTYADASVNLDEQWQENFVIDDVYAGYYEIVVQDGPKKYTQEIWVYAYQTSRVEIIVGN